MKYEDSKVKGITKRTLRALEQIAMAADYSLELQGALRKGTTTARIFRKSASTPSRRCLRRPTSPAKRRNEESSVRRAFP